MKKILTLTYNQGFFFKNIVRGIIKGKTEEDIMNKVKIFDSLFLLKEKEQELGVLTEEEKKAFDIKEFDKEVTFEFDSEIIDWLKIKWKDVPTDYKLFNKKGEVAQEGLLSEEECRLYADIKIALEDARVLK